jgi:hypothetical protein
MVRSPEQWCDLRRRAHQRQLNPAGGADYQGGGHGAPQLGDIGPRRLSLGIVWLLAEVSTYAESRMSAFASFMRHAPSVWSTRRAGSGRRGRGRRRSRMSSSLDWVPRPASPSRPQGSRPAPEWIPLPCVRERSVLIFLRLECVVLQTRPAWCSLSNLPGDVVGTHQGGRRTTIGRPSVSRVVVVGSRICRNRVTFAIPWPKRWRTW